MDLNATNSGTAFINQYSTPIRIDVIENNNFIEFIYKETSNITLSVYPPREPEQRVFKIVFSCKDGKWHKSDRIYGEIVEAQSESYIF
jgi:hypothetical protein